MRHRGDLGGSTGELARALIALAVLTLCLGRVAVGAPATSPPSSPAAPADVPPGIEAACEGENPYLVTTCFIVPEARADEVPAIVALRDTPRDVPHYDLATLDQVGAVWGLAFSRPENALYAAAFHKRHLPFGPGGPGAVYRIDMATGAVSGFATVPNAGQDHHSGSVLGPDLSARPWAGKTSLGDLDLNTDASELFVTNLDDRRIYRYALPSGQLLGSFPHGAAGEPWAEDARPFALKFHQGRLYHGVVHSAENSRLLGDLAGHVYSSLPDGSDLRAVGSFPLQYARGFYNAVSEAGEFPVNLNWQVWTDVKRNLLDPRRVWHAVFPMPMLVDIEFTAQNHIVIGLHDRESDLTSNEYAYSSEDRGIGFGDILLGRPIGMAWDIRPSPEHFDDRVDVGDESSQGGLASLPGLDVVANAAFGLLEDVNDPAGRMIGHNALFWYSNDSGNKLRRELVCQSKYDRRTGIGAGSRPAPPLDLDLDLLFPAGRTMGDVEVLCGPTPAPSPTSTVTPTDRLAPTGTPSTTPYATRTFTATPSRTPSGTPSPTTSPTATSTNTAEPAPLYLPLALREPPCTAERPHIDVVLVLDASTSMLELTRAGRTKLDAAREAARLFLDQLELRGPAGGGSPGGSTGDQAALVQFNSDAHLLQPLTGDRAALGAALAGIQSAQFTRIDLGIRAGYAELAGPRHLADHQPALIVLTDGRNNPEPVASAIAAAAEAKAAGMRVFAIGLGEDVETDALVQMASQPADYFAAPDGEDLAAIYRAIAGAVRPCPATWPGPP